jgi:hypothetical protein
MLKKFSIFLFIFSLSATAQEFADSFIIEVFDRYVKVISPKEKSKSVSIVVLNKTLSKIYGKIATDSKDLKYLSIQPKKTKSIQVGGHNKKIMFIPFAPTFQEIELVYGRAAYEIPEQK